MYILFDTNIINRFNPRTPRADVIRALRASGQHQVGITSTVLEEMAAHQAQDYMEQRQAATVQLNGLRKKMPWKPATVFEVAPLELEECLEYWRSVYSELFEVMPASGEAALKALAREALALPPAKRGAKRSEGGRDAAIWFTIIEYLRRFPKEEVCFVTDNVSDFGDGVSYTFPMDQDLGELAGRLKRLKTFDDVVTTFTEPVDGDFATAGAQRYLGSQAVVPEVGRLALAQHAVLGFPGIDSAGGVVEWRGWVVPPLAALLETGQAAGHRIGEQVWCTAESTWLLDGVAATADGRLERVSCAWKVKLLFPVDESEQEAPTLLSSGDPTLPDMQDKTTVDALEGLRAEVAREAVAVQTRRHEADAQVREALGSNMSARLGNALFSGTTSHAAESVRGLFAVPRAAEWVRAAIGVPSAMESVAAMIVRPSAMESIAARRISSVEDVVAQTWLPIFDGLDSVLDITRIDVAATLPTYTLAAAGPSWLHEEVVDQVEEGPNDHETDPDDSEGSA